MSEPPRHTASDSAAKLEGTLVAGRYRIERVLGEGSSSCVYTAVFEGASAPDDTFPEPGTRVALKLVHPHLARDPQVAQRFNREARIVQRLRGEHLAAFLDAGETADGQLYLAQQLVSGQPLDVVADSRPLPVERALRIVLQICQALQVAHEAGVVHRDLKPQNVMLERDAADNDHVRVLDFGMAKILHGHADHSSHGLTQPNMVFGTPEYVAPEQARGDDVDARADIYSTGVLLYELLTGTVPFALPTPVATLTAHLTNPPEPPSVRAPSAGIPPAVEALVLHTLAKQPEQRYATAAELARAVTGALEQPMAVGSVRPSSAQQDLGTCDTDLALEAVALLPTEVDHAIPEPLSRNTDRVRPSWSLWVVGTLAALLGVILGLLMSMASAR